MVQERNRDPSDLADTHSSSGDSSDQTVPEEERASAEQDEQEGDDPFAILDEPDPIFANKTLVNIDEVPDPDKIVGRKKQITDVVKKLKPASTGESGSGAMIYGKSGTGKSLVAEYVSQNVAKRAAEHGTHVEYAAIDCAQERTETNAVKEIARQLNREDMTTISLPEKGLATSTYYKRLWQIIDELYDAVIIILDEIDGLRGRRGTRHENADSDLLMQLSRAGEGRKTKLDAGLNIVAISNDIKYAQNLDARVSSSFDPDNNSIVFEPYDATNLNEILEKRREAFHDGVLTSDVIPLVSAFAAQEYGDARRAIGLFRRAGERAIDASAERVTESHVREANREGDVENLKDFIRVLPTQAKLAITALAALDYHTGQRTFSSGVVYRTYKLFAGQIDADIIGRRSVLDQIKEHDTNNLVDRNKRSGYAQGVHIEMTLLDDADLVLQTIMEDSRLSGLDIEAFEKPIQTIVYKDK